MSGEKRLILAFTCTYCAYAAAEAAGVSKLHYPPNVHVIRLPCSGMFKSSHVLKALRKGFDGVLWAGCHPPYDCHFINGNYKARLRAILLSKLLNELGFESNRFKLEWISAGESVKFTEVVRNLLNDISKLPKINILDIHEIEGD